METQQVDVTRGRYLVEIIYVTRNGDKKTVLLEKWAAVAADAIADAADDVRAKVDCTLVLSAKAERKPIARGQRV